MRKTEILTTERNYRRFGLLFNAGNTVCEIRDFVGARPQAEIKGHLVLSPSEFQNCVERSKSSPLKVLDFGVDEAVSEEATVELAPEPAPAVVLTAEIEAEIEAAKKVLADLNAEIESRQVILSKLDEQIAAKEASTRRRRGRKSADEGADSDSERLEKVGE